VIKNERQYRITKAMADRFEKSLRELSRHGPAADPLLHKAQVDAAASQLEEMRGQLHEYEALSSGRMSSWRFASIDDLPGALMRARIASGRSQKDLADELGLKEQQIQRYEATDYESASLTRVMEIADALHLQLEGTASVDKRAGSAKRAV
jgi:ribosome-binding protein aMBF1 (putative translation factor)